MTAFYSSDEEEKKRKEKKIEEKNSSESNINVLLILDGLICYLLPQCLYITNLGHGVPHFKIQ